MLAWAQDEASDLSVLEGAVSAGSLDVNDTYRDLGGATQECIDIQEAAGLPMLLESETAEGEPDQYVSSLTACRQMFLLRAILDSAGPELNFGTFRAAGDSLGEIDLPGFPDPLTFGPPPAADGDPVPTVYEFDSAAGAFVVAEG